MRMTRRQKNEANRRSMSATDKATGDFLDLLYSTATPTQGKVNLAQQSRLENRMIVITEQELIAEMVDYIENKCVDHPREKIQVQFPIQKYALLPRKVRDAVIERGIDRNTLTAREPLLDSGNNVIGEVDTLTLHPPLG